MFLLNGNRAQNAFRSKENRIDFAGHDLNETPVHFNRARTVVLSPQRFCLHRKLRPKIFKTRVKIWQIGKDLLFHTKTAVGYVFMSQRG